VKIANAIFMPNSEEPSSYREIFALLARDVYIDRTLMERYQGWSFTATCGLTSIMMCQKRTC